MSAGRARMAREISQPRAISYNIVMVGSKNEYTPISGL